MPSPGGDYLGYDDEFEYAGLKKPAVKKGTKRKTGGETSATRRGRLEHVKWQKQKQKQGYEVEVDLGSAGRADAVHKKNRVVIEYKPNNPKAIADGYRQLDRYIPAARRKFRGSGWRGWVEVY